MDTIKPEPPLAHLLTIQPDTPSRHTYYVKQTANGWRVRQMCSFVCLWFHHITRLPDGGFKDVVRVDRNYSAPFRYTQYFNADGQVFDNLKAYKASQQTGVAS